MTVDGLLKELTVYGRADNLVRSVMMGALQRQCKAVGRISFVYALGWLADAR